MKAQEEPSFDIRPHHQLTNRVFTVRALPAAWPARGLKAEEDFYRRQSTSVHVH